MDNQHEKDREVVSILEKSNYFFATIREFVKKSKYYDEHLINIYSTFNIVELKLDKNLSAVRDFILKKLSRSVRLELFSSIAFKEIIQWVEKGDDSLITDWCEKAETRCIKIKRETEQRYSNPNTPKNSTKYFVDIINEYDDEMGNEDQIKNLRKEILKISDVFDSFERKIDEHTSQIEAKEEKIRVLCAIDKYYIYNGKNRLREVLNNYKKTLDTSALENFDLLIDDINSRIDNTNEVFQASTRQYFLDECHTDAAIEQFITSYNLIQHKKSDVKDVLNSIKTLYGCVKRTKLAILIVIGNKECVDVLLKYKPNLKNVLSLYNENKQLICSYSMKAFVDLLVNECKKTMRNPDNSIISCFDFTKNERIFWSELMNNYEHMKHSI